MPKHESSTTAVQSAKLPACTGTHKVELRNVQHVARMSEETECFVAVVYIDGVKVGEVSNEGHGGCHRYETYAMQRRLEEIAKSAPKIDLHGDGSVMLDCDADSFINTVLYDHLEKKFLAKKCKTHTLYRDPAVTYKQGQWHSVNLRFSPEVKLQIMAKYPGAVILNETLAA